MEHVLVDRLMNFITVDLQEAKVQLHYIARKLDLVFLLLNGKGNDIVKRHKKGERYTKLG